MAAQRWRDVRAIRNARSQGLRCLRRCDRRWVCHTHLLRPSGHDEASTEPDRAVANPTSANRATAARLVVDNPSSTAPVMRDELACCTAGVIARAAGGRHRSARACRLARHCQTASTGDGYWWPKNLLTRREDGSTQTTTSWAAFDRDDRATACANGGP